MTIEEAENNVIEARKALELAEAKLAKAKKLGNKLVGMIEEGSPYHYMGWFGTMRAYTRPNAIPDKNTVHPQFKSRKACDKFAGAINTWMELAACDGVIPKEPDCDCWIIGMVSTSRVYSFHYGYLQALDNISPGFDSEENADAAIEKVGPERIIKMLEGFGMVGC